MKHEDYNLARHIKIFATQRRRRRRPWTRSIVSSYTATNNRLTQLHGDWRSVITRRRYPTANVARQAMLTYRVGVVHPSHLQHSYEYKRNWTEDAQNNNVIIVSCISYRAANLERSDSRILL